MKRIPRKIILRDPYPCKIILEAYITGFELNDVGGVRDIDFTTVNQCVLNNDGDVQYPTSDGYKNGHKAKSECIKNIMSDKKNICVMSNWK